MYILIDCDFYSQFIQMNQRLINIYSKRLDNLSDILANIHEIVGVDQCLALLNDENLIKYKIDRVNELVKQVLESQKEKIIIELINKLNKTHHVSAQNKQKEQEQSIKKIVYQKNNEIENVRLEVKLLAKQRDEQKKVYAQQKQQFSLYKQKYRDIQQKYDKFLEENQTEIRQQQRKSQQLRTKYQQILSKYKNLEEDNGRLYKENDELKEIRKKEQRQTKNLLGKSKLHQFQTTKQKIQKIDAMKLEIKRLNLGLSEMKEMFKIIKENVVRSIINELRGLKMQLKQLKEYICQQIQQMISYSINKLQKMIKDVRQDQADEKLMEKMENLEDQLNKFIQNKLLV